MQPEQFFDQKTILHQDIEKKISKFSKFEIFFYKFGFSEKVQA